MTNIVFTPAAAALVKTDIRSFKTDGKRYAAYVTEMGVTLENVADHVGAFRDAFKAANPKADGEAVKAYATKVRNGLNRTLGKSTNKTEPTALLTALGAAATLAEVTAAWNAAQA